MTEPHSSEAPNSAVVARLVERLGNGDINWDGTLDGYIPRIVGDAAQQLLATGVHAIPQLVGALDDEHKFIAAHVLLTMLSGVEYVAAPWNGLKIELSADNKARIDPNQRFELARHWRTWQNVTPSPRTLLRE
jgi:hypothetical protein